MCRYTYSLPKLVWRVTTFLNATFTDITNFWVNTVPNDNLRSKSLVFTDFTFDCYLKFDSSPKIESYFHQENVDEDYGSFDRDDGSGFDPDLLCPNVEILEEEEEDPLAVWWRPFQSSKECQDFRNHFESEFNQNVVLPDRQKLIFFRNCVFDLMKMNKYYSSYNRYLKKNLLGWFEVNFVTLGKVIVIVINT